MLLLVVMLISIAEGEQLTVTHRIYKSPIKSAERRNAFKYQIRQFNSKKEANPLALLVVAYL